MTKMLPAEMPEGTTASESEVFHLIRDASGSEQFICLHSLGIARHSRKEYSEADFILIGPPGVFCLEVKGGEVRREDGIWRIGWPTKSYTSVEGPFKQAEGARWALIDYLRERIGPSFRDILFGWGVMFPDICFDATSPEWDNQVVFDQRDKVRSFIAYVDRLESYFRQRATDIGRLPSRRLTISQVLEIARYLRGNFDVVPSLKGLLLESERELVSLSTDQFKVLDFALNDGNPRILCDGGAGTGKTLIAVEAAHRLSKTSLSVLLLCYNTNLGRFLKIDAAELGGSVRVETIYSFLTQVIKQGGFGEELAAARRSVGSGELFDVAYPDLFENACAALLEEGELPQYDAVVVDEAQDILSVPLMNCLDLVLKDGLKNGRWLMFFDSGAQAGVYGRLSEDVMSYLDSLKAAKFILKENLRNPKTVISEMCALTELPVPVCRRETVSNVDYRAYCDARDQGRKLRGLLVELLRAGISPERVTILSAVSEPDSCARLFPPDVGKRIEQVGSGNHGVDVFTTSSIPSFKGLENDCIILTDLPDAPCASWTPMLYVGMTRARSKLFVLVTEAFLNMRTLLMESESERHQ